LATPIPVPREIIDGAHQAVSRHCMISDAVAAFIPHAVNVISDAMTTRWTDQDRGLRDVFSRIGVAFRTLKAHRFEITAPLSAFIGD
jgi:hypothetical protein